MGTQMDDSAVLKMLFEEHHRQLAEGRRYMHALTERTVGVLLLLTGWIVIAESPRIGRVRLILIASIVAVSLGACALQFVYHRGYARTARVIAKLNQALELYNAGRFLPDAALYPDSWKTFGSGSRVGNFLLHSAVIMIMGGLCVAATLTR